MTGTRIKGRLLIKGDETQFVSRAPDFLKNVTIFFQDSLLRSGV